MKRTISLLLAAVMLLTGFTGCQEAPAETTAPPQSVQPQQTEAVPTETQFAAADIRINEVMPDNKLACMGHTLDWVELYNAQETPVALDGYYLTDDVYTPNAFSLEGLEIPAEGYLAVPLAEDAVFHLSSEGETVYLICGKEIVSQLEFGMPENGESFDGEGVCQWSTPGYANTEDGYYTYLEALTLPELIITEVMTSNSKHLAYKGKYYDLVEVKNNSSQALDLSGYTLTDKRSEPQRYSFPAVTLQPGEYYVVYCSDDASLGENHAAFKISASGETLYIANNGSIIDALSIPADLKKNESFGREGNIPVYLAKPTFGEENAAGYLTGVAVPTASVPSGIYEEAVAVTLSAEGTIYYTTDGSRPTKKSKVYKEPIHVKGVTTIRTFCVSGERSSAITAYTYAVGAEHDLPVVCVAIPKKSLNGTNGILNNIEKDYEYEAVLTLIEDGEEKFSVPFGFRLHGNDSRKGAKQNFQLRFRSEYGVGKLEYPVFEDREFTEYNSLLLKGGSEDWYSAIMRDELATAIANGTTNLYTQAMKPVVLYLGGEYWGIYYLRERFSDDYVASHLGVEPETVDLLYSIGASAESGSGKEFQSLRNYVKNHNMSKDEHFDYLMERIDAVSLMDWYICRSYMGDKDIANIRRFRSKAADGKWHWMYYDLDWAFCHTTDKPLSSIADRSSGEHLLFQALLDHPTGRDMFLKRYAELLDTILNEEYFNKIIDEIVEAIESEVPRDRARWKQTVKRWEKSVQKLRNYTADGVRTKNVLADLKSYFKLSEAEMQQYFG